MRVGIDIDGVLYPFNELANAALVERFGIPDPGPWTYWNYLKDVVTREQWSWLWSAQGQDVVFGHVEAVYPGVVEAFSSILKSGHEVHFVTHRDPRRTALHTAAFLTFWFGSHPWAGVHVIQRGMAKHRLAEWDVFVDDKAETCEEMLFRTRAQVFAPVRPWNAELERFHSEHSASRLIHYTDPRQVADWVLSQ